MAAAAWNASHIQIPLTPHQALESPRSGLPVQPHTLPSFMLHNLLQGPALPLEPLSLVVSPVPAALTDGVPPT